MLQYISSSETFKYITIVLFSMVLVFLSIPSIIHVAQQRSIFDDIDVERKNHSHGIARLGGVAIFCSFMITCLLISNINGLSDVNYLLTASMVLFVVGLKDDMWGVNPSTKFGMQFIIAAIIVILANVRLTSFYNIFFIQDLPYVPSVVFSMLVIMFLTNAFNLIDGIDGLAGTTGLIVNATLGLMFARMGEISLACIAFSLAGACIGFLRYNLTPAKIFMGDTGSLLLGFVSAVLCIKFIELNKTGVNHAFVYKSAPAIAMAVLIGPIFDAFRVFSIRLLKRKSPFSADRNHVHHRMLNIGFNHLQTTGILGGFNVLMIFIALGFRDIGNFWLIALLFFICVLFNLFLTFFVRSKERNSYSFNNFLW
ncbi:undecaprenyl/decaprenyl-phosphate alpha-N-acetylglucosaminyl 1-phosphate transferase [Pedobacter sp. HMF7647]|uniref:Undecaprenyl/decaprenyl-phosphate alpha-N-acetylglucosaminyl 1-phosphate transferase n=1 Tax=Hufsiella arboris TaxID=2695275 RepID=A0A7K1YEC6_9SPHI|nr:MraY family glycosyltransferase [Hufsiella arboris]MXV52760.1 undecaprenyl/decaprenyl-phosphate alpha-N-acetylglucosaminyl 1-phosphate transferase [Hufsiella arboris]